MAKPDGTPAARSLAGSTLLHLILDHHMPNPIAILTVPAICSVEVAVAISSGATLFCGAIKSACDII